jgi:hypothetical protein
VRHSSRPLLLLPLRSVSSSMRSLSSCLSESGASSLKSSLARSSSIELMLEKTKSAHGAWSQVCSLNYLNDVSSLRLPPPSSSSDASRLAIRELTREFCFEAKREFVGEACLDFCFLDTVLPLSSAFRRRTSCILTSGCVSAECGKCGIGQMIGVL